MMLGPRRAAFVLESPWQGGWAPLAQKPCSIANGNTVNRVLLESPWQGGWAPMAQRPCSIANGNTVNRVLLERACGEDSATESPASTDSS